MRYSVIIPAYNALRNLPRAIESCLRQSLPPVEILVVDDASPESPADRLRSLYAAEFAAGSLRLMVLPVNSGPSTARNTGWDAATGDYIAFLDADDHWDDDRLATISEWLTAEPDTDWFAHRYRLPGEQRAEATNTFGKPYALSLKRLLLGNVAQTSCVVLRTSIPMRFDERMRHCEDYDLWLRIAASGYRTVFSETAFTELDRPQLTAGGLSGNRWAMRRGEMRAYRHLAHLRPALKPALPFLYAYSLVKHARRALISR